MFDSTVGMQALRQKGGICMGTRRNPYQYDPEYYIQGNTVKKLNRQNSAQEKPLVREHERPARQPERRPQKTPSVHKQPAQEQQKRLISIGRGINLLGMVVLSFAMFATVRVCIGYLELQAESTRLEQAIEALESELGLLVDANNAKENKITSDIDLEVIYQKAVGELGMVFPNHNEVLYYDEVDLSYVRQYADIPEAASSILDKLVP